MKTLVLVLVALLGLTGVRILGAENPTIRAEIVAAEQKWIDAFNRHDPDALAELYLPDAQSFQQDIGILKGQEAIRKHFKEMAKQEKELTQSVKTLDVFSQGDLVTETGNWYVKNEDSSVADEGTYWMVWQKKDGAWKVLREIWNRTNEKVALADPLKVVERLLGNWVSEGEMEGKPLHVSLTAKPVGGGAAILMEGTMRIDGKITSEWADLIYYRPESKTIVDIGVSKAEGHGSSDLHVLGDRIVYQEAGYEQNGVSYVRLSELVFDGPGKMRLTQHFGYRGGTPMEDLVKNAEIKRVE